MAENGSELTGSTAPFGSLGSTWLTEGLDAACRMLRDEADATWHLTRSASMLADTVAWQSASAEAYRIAVADLAREVEAAARLLGDVATAAVGLRDQAVAQSTATGGAGW